MKKLMIIIFTVSIAVLSCIKDNSSNDGTSRLLFRLTDAPADYKKVNVDIIGAQVIINDSIIDLVVNEGIYNLLDFVNGKDTLIVDQQIPAGKLSQVRLILGENNTIVIGEEEAIHDLKTPSAQQSGLKFNIHADFVSGVAYEYVIDFDAARSIVETGNGKFILKPVIKVFTNSVSGAIKGIVDPIKSRPTIYAISGQNDSATVFADTISGKFMFRGLATGLYNVSFVPLTPYSDKIIKDVEVRTGMATEMDTVKFD